MFEYLIIVSLSERATFHYLKSESSFERNAYKNMLLCYYVGQLCGRSSLPCFKLSSLQISLVSFLQFLNVCVFWTVAKSEWMSIGQMMVLMTWTGMMGGLSYANCFFQIIDSKNIDKVYRELALNFAGVVYDSGIFFVCVLSIILANTVFIKN